MFGDKKIGSIGDISLFSFYFGHHITTIEGGMVCVNNPKLYEEFSMNALNRVKEFKIDSMVSRYMKIYLQKQIT